MFEHRERGPYQRLLVHRERLGGPKRLDRAILRIELLRLEQLDEVGGGPVRLGVAVGAEEPEARPHSLEARNDLPVFVQRATGTVTEL